MTPPPATSSAGAFASPTLKCEKVAVEPSVMRMAEASVSRARLISIRWTVASPPSTTKGEPRSVMIETSLKVAIAPSETATPPSLSSSSSVSPSRWVVTRVPAPEASIAYPSFPSTRTSASSRLAPS